MTSDPSRAPSSRVNRSDIGRESTTRTGEADVEGASQTGTAPGEATSRRNYIRAASALGVATLGAGCLRGIQSEGPPVGSEYADSDRVAWHLPIGGPGRDTLQGVFSSRDGPVVYGGRVVDDSSVAWTLARTPDGNGRWEDTREASGQYAFSTDGIELSSGRYAFAVHSLEEKTHGELLVMEPDGEVAVHERFTPGPNAYFNALVERGDGTLVLGGRYEGADGWVPWFRGVTPEGDLAWRQTPPDRRHEATGIASHPAGALAVGISRDNLGERSGWTAIVSADGVSMRANMESSAFEVRSTGDEYLVRTEAGWHRVGGDGRVLQRGVYGGHGLPMAKLDDGRMFVGETDDDGLIVVTDEDGNERWRERIGGELRDRLVDAIALQESGALVVGTTTSFTSSPEGDAGENSDQATTRTPARDSEPRSNGWIARIDP